MELLDMVMMWLKRLSWCLFRVVRLSYAWVFAIAGFFQGKAIYRPTRTVRQTPRDIGLDYEEVELIARDGTRITGWYVPARQGHKTLIFCHGNAGNISQRLYKIAIFHGLGQNCLIFDYRGYGKSEGKPSEKGTYLDAEAAYEWLRNVKGAEAADIVVYGESLGGSIAANLAAASECGGLILEGAFTSFPALAKRLVPYMPALLMSEYKYDTGAAVENVRCPVLVIHSKDDEMIPLDFGKELFMRAGEPRRYVEIRGSHDDGFIVSEATYKRELRDWFGQYRLAEEDTAAAGATAS
jgi:fermentation-respiration switch protein FrsA (DUF1100 family)